MDVVTHVVLDLTRLTDPLVHVLQLQRLQSLIMLSPAGREQTVRLLNHVPDEEIRQHHETGIDHRHGERDFQHMRVQQRGIVRRHAPHHNRGRNERKQPDKLPEAFADGWGIECGWNRIMQRMPKRDQYDDVKQQQIDQSRPADAEIG